MHAHAVEVSVARSDTASRYWALEMFLVGTSCFSNEQRFEVLTGLQEQLRIYVSLCLRHLYEHEPGWDAKQLQSRVHDVSGQRAQSEGFGFRLSKL